MTFLDEIYLTWLAIDAWLSGQGSASSPDPTTWLRKAELSSYAFFVLLFGQLEDHINHFYEENLWPLGRLGFHASGELSVWPE